MKRSAAGTADDLRDVGVVGALLYTCVIPKLCRKHRIRRRGNHRINASLDLFFSVVIVREKIFSLILWCGFCFLLREIKRRLRALGLRARERHIGERVRRFVIIRQYLRDPELGQAMQLPRL